MQVETILQSKGHTVYTVEAGAPLSEAVHILNTKKIGAVIVVDAKGGEAETGRVTSAAFSPAAAAPVALAYVARDDAAPGTTLAVRHNGESLPAVVTGLPFLAA